MEEREFKSVLNLFPVVRSRDAVIDEDSLGRSNAGSSQNEVREWQDEWGEGGSKGSESQGSYQQAAFWEKLKLAAQEKVGKSKADRFCSAFRQLHQKLVFEELDLNAAENFVKSRSPKQ